jgi:lysozyme family protein
MADFTRCLSFVLPHEAGTPPSYAVTADNKGQVCAGINSLAFPADFAAIASLPIEERPAAVQAFYQRTYWSQWMADLDSNNIAAYAFDAEVNEGQRIGIDILQEGVDACGGSIAVDGGLGPLTVAAANAVPSAALLGAMHTARNAAYRRIGGPNLTGWLNRAADLPNLD